ncbi:type VI secretion system baseplate subunit TssF, partial [Klebsiella michiganensis]|uniref:type VI secretion system baseplate subunit TssF n=1 Tax=Klebsiella michiganensis TaxID=1134687 RepID=UPI000B271FCB
KAGAGMKTVRPLWGRGQMVSPQHFQQEAAQAAWHTECVARLGAIHPWGVARTAFDAALLKQGKLKADHLCVRFADGTLTDSDNADALPPVMTLPENEKLSLSLTGTNGQLPRRALQSTLLDTVVKSTTARIQVRNLCAPTLPCYPPDRDRFHWRVLSHLGSSFLWMMDNADVLRGALALYDWTDNEMNRRRLEAIVDVRHSEVERFAQGHFLRGVQIEVTLDSSGFAGHGDICLFGEMLNRFFALYTDIHLFNHLILILQPGGERLEWQENHNRRIPG